MASSSPRIATLVALLAGLPAAGHAQDNEPDNGTDPTKLPTSAIVQYERLHLPSGADLGTLKVTYALPVSADRRTALQFRIPAISLTGLDGGLGLSDVSIKATRVVTVTPSYGAVVSAEYLFNTADAPERGTGSDVVKLTGIYARFLPGGAILAPSLLQTFSVGDVDPGRVGVNVTTIDMYYVPRLKDPRAYMTVDPAVIYDWKRDEISGALAVTYGKSVDLGLPGNESLFIKPSIGIGAHRVSDYGIEIGIKTIGF